MLKTWLVKYKSSQGASSLRGDRKEWHRTPLPEVLEDECPLLVHPGFTRIPSSWNLQCWETGVYLDKKQQYRYPGGFSKFQSLGKLGQTLPLMNCGGTVARWESRAEQSETCWQCQPDNRVKKEARKASYFKVNSSCIRIT